MTRAAKVVVIGGGVAGCSLLYHLTKLGWSDVILLDMARSEASRAVIEQDAGPERLVRRCRLTSEDTSEHRIPVGDDDHPRVEIDPDDPRGLLAVEAEPVAQLDQVQWLVEGLLLLVLAQALLDIQGRGRVAQDLLELRFLDLHGW